MVKILSNLRCDYGTPTEEELEELNRYGSPSEEEAEELRRMGSNY
jgi:hypothetical protein